MLKIQTTNRSLHQSSLTAGAFLFFAVVPIACWLFVLYSLVGLVGNPCQPMGPSHLLLRNQNNNSAGLRVDTPDARSFQRVCNAPFTT